MRPLHKPTFDDHLRTIYGQCRDDFIELLTSRRSYLEVRERAAERNGDEINSWSALVRWYVGSQVLLLDRNLTPAPHERGLAKVIVYAGKHAEQIMEFAGSWTGSSAHFRSKLNRASPEYFTKEESDRDLEILLDVRRGIRFLRLRSGEEWNKLFSDNCRKTSSNEMFHLPNFEELDLAINTVFELYLKYAELLIGKPHHVFTYAPSFTNSGLIAPIAAEWQRAEPAGQP